MVKVLGRRRAATAVVLFAGCALMTTSGVAEAQNKPSPPASKPAGKPKKPLTEKQRTAEAKRLFKEAKAKYEANDFAGALPLYKQADEIYEGPSPKYFYAACLDRLERFPEAVAAYEAFLKSTPEGDSKFADKVASAKTRVAEIQKTPARVAVTTEPATPPGLKFTIDGAEAPGPELAVPPGKHVIGASAEGYAATTQEIDVAFGEKRALTLTLNEAPKGVAAAPKPKPKPADKPDAAPQPVDAKDDGSSSRIPAYVTLGLAGAGAIVGTIFGVQALGAKSDFDASPTTDNADKAERNALIADMSFAVAITFGVTGTVLLLSSSSGDKKAGRAGPPPRKRAFVTPYVGPRGGGAAAFVSF